MPAFNLLAALRQVAYQTARTTRSIISVVQGTIGGLSRTDLLDNVLDVQGKAKRAIREATNYKALRSVNLNARPTVANTMLAERFKTPDDYRYAVEFQVQIPGQPGTTTSNIQIYSNDRLTKQQAIDLAQVEAYEASALGLRSGLSEQVNITGFDLVGAYYAEGKGLT